MPTRAVGYQTALLVVLLSLTLVGFGSSDVVFGGFHPVSPLMVGAYLAGLVAGRRVGGAAATEVDDGSPARDASTPNPPQGPSTGRLLGSFTVLGTFLVASGIGLSTAGASIAEATPLSATAVGLLLTAVATSTPELVTAVSAARRGAIGLAVGDIIGGNVFDCLFVAAADVVAPTGVFASVGEEGVALAGLALLLNGVLLAGIMRQGKGRRNVDAESIVISAVWLAGVLLIVV